MKLNLGCGFNRLEGFWNVDREPSCRPDEVVDLERFPWPWEDGSVTEVMAYHSLEHLGQAPETFIGIMKELWRVCAPGAVIRVAVPHPNHENFQHDPTHVRIVTPITIAMFDQARNIRDAEAGGQETKLGLYAGIDLEVVEVTYDLEEPWRSKLISGEIASDELNRIFRTNNNVCYQIRMVARAVKPPRGAEWLRSR